MNEQELERWRESLKKGDVVYLRDHDSGVRVAVIAKAWGEKFKINRVWYRDPWQEICGTPRMYPTAEAAQAVHHARIDDQIERLINERNRPLPEVTDELIERLRAYKGRGK